MAEKIRVVAVAGPTASGKSRLAVALAKALHGQVISCDSMQIYKGMDIGTGKVTEEEQDGVRHRLIDIASPSLPFSLAEYTELCKKEIAAVAGDGFLPILCGGTGLYLEHLLKGTVLCPVPQNEELRRELEQFDNRRLHTILQEVDPESASIIHPNNRKRVIRALEIYHFSGVTKASWDAASIQTDSPYESAVVLLLPENRQMLYDAINRRVDRMFKQGLEKEARALFAASPAPTAAQAIGYKEFLPYFAGEVTLEEVKEKIKQASRNYAKRQLTWFCGHMTSALSVNCNLSFEEQLKQAIDGLKTKGF